MQFHWPRLSKGLWPSQISLLDGLESFYYPNDKFHEGYPLTGLHLASLSRHLQNLVLYCESSLDALQDLSVISPSHFQHLKTLDIIFESSSPIIDFEVPRTLTDLTLLGFGPYLPSICLSLLPPSLTQFVCHLESLELGDCKFPTTLKSFEIVLSQYKPWPVILGLLPPEIEKIVLRSNRKGPKFCFDAWTALSSLTNLRTFVCDVHDHFDIKCAELIPRSVETLRLLDIRGPTSEEWCIAILKALPQNLKKLGGSIWPFKIGPEVARHMPRRLEKVKGRIISPEAVPFLPQGFTEIEVAGLFPMTSLPPAVTSLKLTQLETSTLETLPVQLRSLSSSHLLSADVFKRLPKNLTKLDLMASFDSQDGVDLILESLPRALTSLRLMVFPKGNHLKSLVSAHSSLHIPRCVEDLTIGSLDFLEGEMAEWILGLPQNLNRLVLSIKRIQIGAMSSFRCFSALNLLNIDVEQSPAEGWATVLDFRSLPRRLAKLDICDQGNAYNNVSDISDNTLAGAPPFLDFLTLPKSPLLSRACLVHLRNLKNLKIRSFGVPEWFKKQKDPEIFLT
jgi:hypothetical protein